MLLQTVVMRKAWSFVEVAALALAVYALSSGAPGFRESELACEEAFAHLEDCCPPDALENVDCAWRDQGCGESVSPNLSVEESRCIRETSCEVLYKRGVCDNLRTRLPQSGVVAVGACP
jgi:hypothetical protein